MDGGFPLVTFAKWLSRITRPGNEGDEECDNCEGTLDECEESYYGSCCDDCTHDRD